MLLLNGCAKQGYPPGGPEDRNGPRILSSFPESETVLVPRNVRPWVLLDEYPSRTSLTAAVMVNPEPEEGYEVRQRGKRVEIRFGQLLPENRTILIIFGSGLKDLAGNPMDGSFALAFSTGERIDQAGIRGVIEPLGDQAATWIWAYPLATFPEPDPRQDKAPFAAQPNQQGEFKLAFLPEGRYRLFGVVDSKRNRLWDGSSEALAIAATDVAAVKNPTVLVSLRLGACDLQPPELRSAQALHRQGIRLSFSEAVQIQNLKLRAVAQDGQELPLISIYQNPADSAVVLVSSGRQRDGDVYTLHADSVCDRSGNRADSLTGSVTAATQDDTLGPHFTWSYPAEGAQGIELATNLRLGFSEAIVLTDLPRAVRLCDSSGTDIAVDWSYPNPAVGEMTPQTALWGGGKFSVRVLGDSLRDVFGNVSPDSLRSFSFTTLNPQETGALTGTVVLPDESATEEFASLIVVAQQSVDQTHKWQTSVQADGTFTFAALPEAEYHLWVYRDLNGDSQFTAGRLEPFAFSEPFCLSTDTLRLRPRWTTEGVELRWILP